MRYGRLSMTDHCVQMLFARTNGGWDEAAIARGMSEAELALELWKADLIGFSAGGKIWPDRKAVSVLLCSRGGPIKRGWAEWIPGQGRARLTEAGIELAQRLSGAV